MNATLPPQTRLPLHLTAERPLVSVGVVTHCRGTDHLNRDEVLQEITGGKLQWAFNVATKDANRMLVRVFYQSVLEYNGKTIICDVGEIDEAQLLRVIDAILPPLNKVRPDLATVRSSELATRFDCEGMHTINLVRDGLLKATDHARGPKESRLIIRSSIVEFLKQRRIP